MMPTSRTFWFRPHPADVIPPRRSRAIRPIGRVPRFETLEQRLALATLSVSPGLDTIHSAVALAHSGDTLSLLPGLYRISQTVVIDKNLTIKGAASVADLVHVAPVHDSFTGDHIFYVLPAVERSTFANMTIQGGTDSLTDDPEDGGDGIHFAFVEYVAVANVTTSLNGANGIYSIGATKIELTKVTAAANGAFGIDIKTAHQQALVDTQAIGNGLSGIHSQGGHGLATATMTRVTSVANAENGMWVEELKQATLTSVTSSDNGEDGGLFELIGTATIKTGTFSNNMDDGLELTAVFAEASTGLKVFGNRDLQIERPTSAHPATKPGPTPVRTSSTITVSPGLDALLTAVNIAHAGDTLSLKPGVYLLSNTVLIDKNLTIKGASTSADQVHIVPAIAGFAGVHLFSATPPAARVSFANFTLKGAPDFGPDALQQGDGIHTEGVESVTITNIQSSLNGGDGIFIVGAVKADLSKITALANNEFGFDTDATLNLIVRDSKFLANGISGLEAAGHEQTDITFTALVSITNTVAQFNGEIGIEVERFKQATFKAITCSNNTEDGFDADRVYVVEIADSTFSNNLDDGLELFPIDVAVYPPDFPFNIIERYTNLKIFGNRGLAINHPATEN
jgi:hypothetical protein